MAATDELTGKTVADHTIDRHERDVTELYEGAGLHPDQFTWSTQRIVEWLADSDHDVYYGVLGLLTSAYCQGLADADTRTTTRQEDEQ